MPAPHDVVLCSPTIQNLYDFRPFIAQQGLVVHDQGVFLIRPAALADVRLQLVEIALATLLACPPRYSRCDFGPINVKTGGRRMGSDMCERRAADWEGISGPLEWCMGTDKELTTSRDRTAQPGL
mgnify:CR=1 FL=1